MAIDYFFNHHVAPSPYTYSEGEKDEISAMHSWERTCGWDIRRFGTPDKWTAAELFPLLQDCLAREHDDALIIGFGVPVSWMNESISVTDLPTRFGKLSFTYDPTSATACATVENPPPGGIRLDFPRPANLKMN